MKPLLLLYVSSIADLQRTAVGPALARLAELAGARFECYYDQPRRGRHFGAGDPADAPVGLAGGSPVAGGHHLDHVLRLALGFRMLAVGDPHSVVWPAVEVSGAEVLAATTDPAEIYQAVLARLGLPAPAVLQVLDARPQGPGGLRLAPYLAPAFLIGEPALGLEVGAGADVYRRVQALGARRCVGWWLDPERAAAAPVEFEALEGTTAGGTYASVTAALAERHAGWGRGVLLADPDLAAAQLGRLVHRRLLPVYGRPQVDVIDRVSAVVRRASEPVFGRQYDDRDFLALARLGKGLQVVDPPPPFTAAEAAPRLLPRSLPPAPAEPSDAQLQAWAGEGRVLVSLCLWAGMVREVDGISRLLDLVADTGLRAGLVVTAETVAYDGVLAPLTAPPERGGVHGLVELLLGSTGFGVAAETLLPRGVFGTGLQAALAQLRASLPPGLVPRGWWPLLDTPLVAGRRRLVGRRGLVPALSYTPPSSRVVREPAGAPAGGGGRSLARDLVRSPLGRRLFVPRRPFESQRPGALDPVLADDVRRSGLDFMFTKAGFGVPAVCWRHGEFVAIPFTAGNWDGWSPFYTVGSVADVDAAERRLTRGARPGWLVSTVDSPLFALGGEVWEHGARLYDVVARVAAGGRSGRLVNVTPSVLARYARLLDDQRAA